MDERRLSVVKESSKEIVITLKYPQLHYLNEFIRLKCAPTLLESEMFPNIKEITESMTALNALRRHVGASNFAKTWTLFDVGCGHAPRTAALLAHITRWDCYAIDPVLKQKARFLKTRRLTLIDRCVEDIEPFFCTTAVVTAVHAHVKLSSILEKVQAKRMIIVAMPCCKPLELPDYSCVEYKDMGCLSPKRTVKIYDISN